MKNQQTIAKSAERAERDMLDDLRTHANLNLAESSCDSSRIPSFEAPGPRSCWIEKARNWLERAVQRAEKCVTENFRVPPNGG